MSREKQIEEMALTLSEGGCGNECDCIQGDKFNCHLLHSASVLYSAGCRKQEWISVDERLPEIEGTYLAYTSRRTIEIAHFYPYYVNGKPQFDYWITHWMPLPEAPKMKGGAE